jgi:hypothetical protein
MWRWWMPRLEVGQQPFPDRLLCARPQGTVEARVSHLAAYLRSFTGQEPSDADVARFMRFIAAR